MADTFISCRSPRSLSDGPETGEMPGEIGGRPGADPTDMPVAADAPMAAPALTETAVTETAVTEAAAPEAPGTGAPPAGSAPITLAPILDLPQAGDLRDAIMAAGDSAITVDACQVEVIGALAQQVLLSAARTWRARGRAFTITAASPAFLACTRTLGLDFTPFLEGAEE